MNWPQIKVPLKPGRKAWAANPGARRLKSLPEAALAEALSVSRSFPGVGGGSGGSGGGSRSWQAHCAVPEKTFNLLGCSESQGIPREVWRAEGAKREWGPLGQQTKSLYKPTKTPKLAHSVWLAG